MILVCVSLHIGTARWLWLCLWLWVKYKQTTVLACVATIAAVVSFSRGLTKTQPHGSSVQVAYDNHQLRLIVRRPLADIVMMSGTKGEVRWCFIWSVEVCISQKLWWMDDVRTACDHVCPSSNLSLNLARKFCKANHNLLMGCIKECGWMTSLLLQLGGLVALLLFLLLVAAVYWAQLQQAHFI